MEFNDDNSIDQLMLNDIGLRIIHAVAVICFTILFSLQASAYQTLIVISLGGLLSVQSIAPVVSRPRTYLSGVWPTIATHLLAFAVISILFLDPGSTYELIWMAIVIAAAFWRGTPGFVVSASGVSAIWVANVLLNSSTDSDGSHLVGYIFTMLISGAILTRYSEIQRKEREAIIRTKRRAVREGNQLRSLINSMADAVIATDRNGVIQLYNAAALLLLNTNQGLKDSKLTDLIKLSDSDGEKVNVIAQAQNERRIIQRNDLVFTNNRDEKVNLYLDLAPIRSGHDNEIDGFIFLLRDITAQKSIEEQRDDFISIISHELRTPIAIAEGNLSTALMTNGGDKKQRRNMIEQAHQNVLYLADLVNDITTLAHAERGDLDEDKIMVNLEPFLREVTDSYKTQIEEAGLKLNYDIDENLPEVLLHKQRLKEIMQDYITNAIRYTDKGKITIIAHELNSDLVRIGVQDTGIGLSKSDQAHVFEKFYRSEDYRTRQHNGTGLGLYIAKKLSELIGLEIGVESKLNEGSLFYIDISTHNSNDVED